MVTNEMVIEHAGAMPASTWHFLKTNDVRIEIPEGLGVSSNVQVVGDGATEGPVDLFAEALAAAQAEWEDAHPEPTPEEIAERKEFLAAEADATYGGTAQSAYQARADALEESRSLIASFEHGLGGEVVDYLHRFAGEHIVVNSSPGGTADSQVIVSAEHGTLNSTVIDVVAARGSFVKLSVIVDGPDSSSADEREGGVVGTTVRVFADAGSRVSVERIQTLEGQFADIDDMGLFVADGACVDVLQTVLGASSSFTGLAGDLRGDQARVLVDTRYLGRGVQKRDFNYSLRHHGQRTMCNLQANGVLAGESDKTLRGTIDFVRGCKGAEGAENETVLLVDEGVRNKTVPVILCNEDDVAGNHGATIGHIRDEQLFYLASRGLSQEAAEAMFVSAMVEQAALEATTELAREAAIRFGETVHPGFAEYV